MDFGCGLGIFTKILAEKFPKISFAGIDIDKARIKTAKQRYKKKNLKFKCSKKITGKYDSASSIFVLHEIKNANKSLREIYKSLNKNGKLLIYDFKTASKKDFRILYKKGTFDGSFEEEFKEHNRWTLKEFEEMCKKAGFKTIEIFPVDKHWLAYVGEKI